MRVLIVPEDPTLDQHILKPVVAHIFEDLGLRARVDVLPDPHITSASQALNPTVVRQIVEDNPMIDVFVLAVDRDCDRQGHSARLGEREKEHPGKLVGVLAWQEVEVWALALHREALGARWADVRAECDPKEAYWDPFVRKQGWLESVGRGRKRAMRELGSRWSGLLQVCPELAELRERIEQLLATRG